MSQDNRLMVSTQSLEKTYELGNIKVAVLKNINLEIPMAKFAVICGPSGSGKTTLLNIISRIDRPTKEKIIVSEQDLTEKDEDFLADFRCNHLSFVFQGYNLVSTLTVAENITFPMEWTRKPEQEVEKRVEELLKTVRFSASCKPFSFTTSIG